MVARAKHRLTNLPVAIKMIPNVFKNQTNAVRALREVTILKQLPQHPNIVAIEDILEPSNDPNNFNTIFFVMRQMQSDLQKLVASKTPLEEKHVQIIMY